MKHIFFLSGDYVGLGEHEVISLCDIKKYNSVYRLFIADLDCNRKLVKRLALTKSIYKVLFECNIHELISTMKKFDWNSVYKDNFCLRIYNFNDDNTITKKSINVKNNKKYNQKKFSEKELAGYVWCSVEFYRNKVSGELKNKKFLSKPKVSLENPKTMIQIFIIKDTAYCGLLIHANNEDFESRKSHLRPFPHPSSLHPKVARALINITGIKEDEVMLDPFCGTGGFLIEAGLMGIKSIGYDINKIMINGCIQNLREYKIKKCEIKNQNALDINDKFDYVVTDLPYGLNSNAMAMYEKNWKKHRINKKIETKNFIENLEVFYLKFLKQLRKKLKKNKKSVIVFPSYVNYRKLLKQSKFRIEKEFENYVHRSLTRKIVKIH